MDSPTFRFGEFAISRDEKLLRRAGEPVALPPKAVQTLLLLLESPGQVISKEEIIAAVWPDAVVEENNLTQQISILRRTLGDGWIQTIPKRGYRFTNAAPAVLPVAPGTSPQLEIPAHRRRWIVPAAIALIAIAAAAFMLLRTPAEIGSVAVLPIQPLTANEELSAIGLGISDAVVQRLSWSRGLEVRPMTAVRKYLGTNADALTVGRELNVDAVLAGTIQRDERRVRITLELVDVRSNRSRWSGKIEEDANDIFRLQDIVAEATLRSLPSTPSVTAAPPRRTPSPAAHEAFLKGRYYWSRRTGSDTERAVDEFERAVALDNSYAAAWAGLASAVNIQSLHFINEPAASFARSRVAAEKALLLDPQLAEAHAALGFISFYYDWNWAEGERAFRRAIALDPTNGNYRQLLSNLMMATSRFDEGIAQIDEAIRVDPASVMVRSVAGRQRYLARRYEESEAILRGVIAMDNSFPSAHLTLAGALAGQGRTAEAARQIEVGLRKGYGPQGELDLAVIAAGNGDVEGARRLIAEAERRTKNGATLHFDLAIVYTALDDFDAAFANLEQAIRKRYSGVVWLNVEPRLDRLRADPRFAGYAKRAGFSRVSS